MTKKSVLFGFVLFLTSSLSVSWVYGDDTDREILILRDTLFESNFIVPAGNLCRINPGITLSFSEEATFVVRGIVFARGNPDEQILFKAADDTAVTTETFKWRGVEIVGEDAIGTFRHCQFSDAYRILSWKNAPTFDSCSFMNNHYGLYAANQATPNVLNCRFKHNNVGLYINFSSPRLLDNVITENFIGIYLQLSAATIIGRNTIENNQTDIHDEKAFGENNTSKSLHQLWNIVNELY